MDGTEAEIVDLRYDLQASGQCECGTSHHGAQRPEQCFPKSGVKSSREWMRG